MNALRTLAVLLAFLTVAPLARGADNELTEQEKKDGWILMFDGKTTAGWKSGTKPMPAKQVEDGALNTKEQGAYVSHYDKVFGDFHFVADFKVDPTVNSGLFFRIAKPGAGDINRGWEIQVKDDHGKPPTRMDCGSLYEYLAPTKQAAKPAGEWNHIEVVAKGTLLKVTLNGEQVIDTDMAKWTEAGKNPDGSKNKFKWALKDMPREGYIGVSFHDKGKSAWFKNMKVKPLTGEAK